LPIPHEESILGFGVDSGEEGDGAERNCKFEEVYGKGNEGGEGVQREVGRSWRRVTRRKRGTAQRIVSKIK
jgi:hypothetical protein